MIQKIAAVVFIMIVLLSMGSLVLAGNQDQPEPAPAQNRGCAIDLMLVLDTSGSIVYEDFDRMRQWVADLLVRFTLGPNDARVGIVQFASEMQMEIGLSDDLQQINNALISMPKFDSGTNITIGLRMAYGELLQHGREDAPAVIVLLTDGEHNEGDLDPISYADSIREGAETGGGVTILGVAVGTFLLNELTGIAGGEHNVVQVPDFASLQQILSILHDYSCAVSPEGMTTAANLPVPVMRSTAVPIAANPASTALPTQPPQVGPIAPTPTITPITIYQPANTSSTAATPVPNRNTTGNCTVRSIMSEEVNRRAGPDLEQPRMGYLQAGQEHTVTGKALDQYGMTWWRLTDGSWVRYDLVGESGNCEGVPLVRP